MNQKSFTFLNVLVTGGAGFIGHHLVKKLLSYGCRVTVLDDLSTGHIENLDDHPKLKLIVGSILDMEHLKSSIKGTDFIFHLASVVGMKNVTQDPDYTYRVAVEGTQNLFKVARDLPVVLFSSSAVYGMSNLEPVREGTKLSIKSILAYDNNLPGYAFGKYYLELLSKYRSRKGLPTLIIRPFNVIGCGQKTRYGMVVPNFIKNALSEEPIIIYDDGLQSRCFSDVQTMLNVIIHLIQHTISWKDQHNVFNVGSDKITRIKELAYLVKSTIGSSSPIIYKPYSLVYPGKEDVKVRIPSLERLHSVIGSIEWLPLKNSISEIAKSFNFQTISRNKLM